MHAVSRQQFYEGGSRRLAVTEYIFYCKRAILFLSSSKILTPHPPLRPGSVYPPPLCCGGRTDSPGGEGDGGSIFWKTREIGLPSYSKICTLWVAVVVYRPGRAGRIRNCAG
jgi:hypothetical protein